MTGITSETLTPFNSPLVIHNINNTCIVKQLKSCLPTPFLLFFSVLIFAILMYVNFKIYFKKSNKTKSRFLKKQNNKGLLMQLILLTLFKCIILAIICFSTKQKISTTHKPHKLVSKNYFLSIEYFADVYHSTELQTKSLHEW